MGPIIIIEDDKDDQEIFRSIIDEIAADIESLFFSNAEVAFAYLNKPEVSPFIIFSDINMPGMNGFQLRDKIQADPVLRIKCIPYIFLTTGGENVSILDAYSKNVQGYFIKPNSLQDWTELLKLVINYWKKSKKP